MSLVFPSSPSIGDEFSGGGFTWTWNGVSWSKVSAVSGENAAQIGFDLVIGTSGNSTFELAALQSAGEYTISSALNDSTYDIYFIDETDQNVGHSTTAKITATAPFKKIVVYGGANNDILSFAFGYVAEPTGNGNVNGGAAPFITSISPNNLPSNDNTMTITGGNFANDVQVILIGASNTQYAPKTTVRTSSTQIVVTRPDGLLVSDGPYDVRVQNPGVPNPVQRSNQLTNALFVGSGVSWVTPMVLPPFNPGQAFTTTLVATDPDSSAISYSVQSGTLPSGLSLNSSTGVVSGTTSSTNTVQVVIRATDAGGNFSDRQFTFAPSVSITGGTTVTSGNYIYTTFTSSTTMNVVRGGPVEVVTIAGGGGGGGSGNYGGGGAGGFLISSTTLSAGSYPIVIGAGGSNASGGQSGSNTTIGSLTALTAIGGGAGKGQYGGNGGSGGGGGQSFGYGTANQGNNGGSATSLFAIGYDGGGGGGGRNGGGGDGYLNYDLNPSKAGGPGGSGINYAEWGIATGTGQDLGGGSRYYAGGGGGVSSGVSAGNGAGHGVNTGGGGLWSQSGDSGLVMIRYPKAG